MAKKGVNIRERPPGSGNWYARYTDEFGRDRHKAAGTKTAAKALAIKLKEEVRLRKLGLKPSAREEERLKLTVDALIERYRPHFESKKAATENKRYASIWKRDLGDLLARDVVPGDIDNWRREQKLRGISNATINRYTAFLKMVFNLGISDEIVDSNPLAHRRVKPLEENAPRERVLSFEEEDLLLPELAPVDQAALVISLNSGMRQGEILGLKRSDIDFERRLAKLRTTKAGKQQVVPLNALALAAITFMMNRHDYELLFPNEAGTGPMSGARMTNRIKEAAAKLGMKDVLFHTARHTFITRLAQDGHDIGVIKAAARHSTITMTDSYMHTTRDATLAAVDGLCSRSAVGEVFPVAPRRGNLRLVK